MCIKVSLEAIILAAVAVQAAAAQAVPCVSFESSVTVEVATAGNTASVSPDRACVSPGGQVNWTASDGESWATDFVNDAASPFPAGRTHHGGNVHQKRGDKVKMCKTNSPHYDSAAGGCVFKYKAAHVKEGNTSVIDPDVVVKPGTDLHN